MKRITSLDLAKVIGVSQSTVSRALADDPRIAKQTRKIIQKKAKELGYTPNEFARSLQASQSNIVGIIMADILNPFYPKVLEIYTQKLRAIGKKLLLFTIQKSSEIDDVLRLILQYQVEGVIVTSAELSTHMATVVHNSNTRVVLFNRSVSDTFMSSVCCDNVSASREVASLLIRAGHRRLAIIGGDPNTSTHRERREGFENELHRHGFRLWGEGFGHNSYGGGYAAARCLLASAEPPDAIFCIADIMGLGAMDAARHEFGLRVPEDVSIVGFDDVPMAAWPSYDLTTVRQPTEAMVSQSLSVLFEKADMPAVAIRVPGELVIRGSARLP